MDNIKITLDSNLKMKVTGIRLGVLTCDVEVATSTCAQQDEFEARLEAVKLKLEALPEKEWSAIAATRSAYKSCGKEPSRYRSSAELLLRRIRTGKRLPSITNVVDVVNLLSFETGYSIGGFDLDAIEGNISCAIGDEQPYTTIGGRDLNIAGMPALRDGIGFFGTPTSDSSRTMITEKCTHILLTFYDFGGHDGLSPALQYAETLLKRWCAAKDVQTYTIPETTNMPHTNS